MPLQRLRHSRSCARTVTRHRCGGLPWVYIVVDVKAPATLLERAAHEFEPAHNAHGARSKQPSLQQRGNESREADITAAQAEGHTAQRVQ